MEVRTWVGVAGRGCCVCALGLDEPPPLELLLPPLPELFEPVLLLLLLYETLALSAALFRTILD